MVSIVLLTGAMEVIVTECLIHITSLIICYILVVYDFSYEFFDSTIFEQIKKLSAQHSVNGF